MSEETTGLKMYWLQTIWRTLVAWVAISGGGKSCPGRLFISFGPLTSKTIKVRPQHAD